MATTRAPNHPRSVVKHLSRSLVLVFKLARLRLFEQSGDGGKKKTDIGGLVFDDDKDLFGCVRFAWLFPPV